MHLAPVVRHRGVWPRETLTCVHATLVLRLQQDRAGWLSAEMQDHAFGLEERCS